MLGLVRGGKPQREVFTAHQICEVLIFFAECFGRELRSENTLRTVECESSVLCALCSVLSSVRPGLCLS